MLTQTCQNLIVKSVFKSVKPILRFARTNAQKNRKTDKKLKNHCVRFYYINKGAPITFYLKYLPITDTVLDDCYDFIVIIDYIYIFNSPSRNQTQNIILPQGNDDLNMNNI